MSVMVYFLAVWRVSRMLYDLSEDGPFDILRRIREIAGVYDAHPNQVAQAITCPYCISVWVGFLFSVISLDKKLFRLLAWPFAASAVVVLIYENMESDSALD